jgi:tetratricopeptide (TPR) repeat protein
LVPWNKGTKDSDSSNSQNNYVRREVATHTSLEGEDPKANKKDSGIVENIAPTSEETEVSLSDLINLRYTKFSVISGAQGAGKSTLMRQAVIAHASDLLPNPQMETNSRNLKIDINRHRLPVTINCRKLNRYDTLNSAQLIENATELVPEAQNVQMQGIIKNAIQNSAAILLIDGLDELNSSYLIEELENSVRRLIEGKDIPVLITTRNLGYESVSFLNPKDVTHFNLKPFSVAQIKEYLDIFYNLNKGDQKTADGEATLAYTQRKERIQNKDWAKNPFFLKIACQAGIEENIENEIDLFPRFFSTTYREYAKRSKTRSSVLNIDVILKSLGILANTISTSTLESINYTDACAVLRQLCLESHCNEHELLKILTDEFSYFIRFIKIETINNYKFEHSIFEAFFASKYIELMSKGNLSSKLMPLLLEFKPKISSYKWREIIRFLILGSGASKTEVVDAVNSLISFAHRDAQLVDVLVDIIIENYGRFEDLLLLDILRLFVDRCKREMSAKKQNSLKDLPHLQERCHKLIGLDSRELFIHSIAECYDNCGDIDIFYIGRLAELYQERRYKASDKEESKWDIIVDIIAYKGTDRILHILTLESLPYKVDDYPVDKLEEIIAALVAALHTKSSTAAARTLNRIFSKRTNRKLVTANVFQQTLAVLLDEASHPYTRYGLINCVRQLIDSDFSESIKNNHTLRDLLIDELDSIHPLNPVAAARALHKVGYRSAKINEILIDGLLVDDFSKSRFELCQALIDSWQRENSKPLLDKIILNEDPTIRSWSLGILSQHAVDGITGGVINHIRKSDYQTANSIIDLAQNNQPMVVADLHKSAILLCVLLKGEIIFSTDDSNPEFRKGYIFLALHIDEYVKLIRDLYTTSVINPKDYNATVLARQLGEPPTDVENFMRHKFGFSNYTIVVQTEETQLADITISQTDLPDIIDEFLDKPLTTFGSKSDRGPIYNLDKANENDIPIRAVNFMRIGSGYIQQIDHKRAFTERIQTLSAYANHINQTFLPSGNEIILLENIDGENEPKENYEIALTKTVVCILVQGRRMSDGQLGYCYLWLSLAELNRLFKELGSTGYIDLKNYDATILDDDIGEPDETVRWFMRRTYGFTANKVIVRYDETAKAPENFVLKTHKVVERYFSTNPLYFAAFDPNIIGEEKINTEDSFCIHSVGSIHIGSGYIYEDQTEEIYATRVQMLSTYAAHINQHFGATSNQQVAFEKNYLDEAASTTGRDDGTSIIKNKLNKLYIAYFHAIMRKADMKIKLQKYKSAIEDLDQIIEIDDTFAAAFEKRGLAHRENGQFKAAISDFAKAIKLQPENMQAIHEKGIAHRLLKEYKESLDSFDAALKIDPTFGKSMAQKGITYGEMGQNDVALECFDNALNLDPNYYWAFYQKGMALHRLKRYQEALNSFDAVLKIAPKHAWSMAQKAIIYRDQEQYEKALTWFEKAIEVEPKYVWAINEKGITLQSMKQYEKALKSFDAVLRIDGTYTESLIRKAVIYREMEQFKEALDTFDKALNVEPKSVWAFNQKGITLRLMKQYDDALNSFDAALALEPNSTSAIIEKAMIYREMEQFKEALDTFDMALKVKPKSEGVFYQKGITLRLMKQYKDALKSFDAALALEPSFTSAIIGKAITYREMEQYEKSVITFNQAIDSGSKNEFALAEKGFTMLLTSSPINEVLIFLNEAVKLSGNNKPQYSYVDRALIHLMNDSVTEAKFDLQSFLRPVSDTLWTTLYESKIIHAAISFWLLDQHEESILLIRKFLRNKCFGFALKSASQRLKQSWKATLKLKSVSAFFDMVDEELHTFHEAQI